MPMPSEEGAARSETCCLPPHAGLEVDLELPAGTLQSLIDLRNQHGDIFGLATRRNAVQTFVVAHPDYAQQVLCTHHEDYRRFMLDGHMSLVLGSGLLVSEGSVWKGQRKLLQRCFHGNALEAIVASADSCGSALLDRWDACAHRGDAVELTGDMVGLSIDLNFNAIFSVDAHDMLDELGVGYLERLTAPMKADTRSNLLFLKDARRVREIILRLIAARRQSGARPVDLLSMFMDARHGDGEAMPDQLIIDEIGSVLTAGHETVASALKSIWYVVSRDASVAQAIRDEVDGVTSRAGPAVPHLASLHYTKRVIQEALRLFPPIWVITHKAERDSRIGAYDVPAGTNVFVCPYLIHRHPDFWPMADAFDPQRFAPQSVAARHKFAYIPYSAGPRNCIGDDLSMLEMLLHVATVSGRFKVSHLGGTPGDYAAGFSLRARTPIHVRLEHRG
ncbi:MAG: cytochrome P450 [Gammaproteobacteria bacterium]